MDKLNNIYKYLRYIFSNRKRAIYIGCLGHNNLGDDAVFHGIVNMVKNKLTIYDISYAKISSGSFLRKIYFPKPDYIILGGGTIIRKGKNESYLRLLNQFSNKYPNAKCFSLGTGVANPEFAQSIGFPTDIHAWSNFLNQCFFVSVRGPLSKNILKNEWKIKPNVEILYDPAIFFDQSLQPKAKKKTIAVNFCDIVGRIHGQNQEEVGRFAKSIVNKLLENGWNIVLYPTTSNDINYMKRVLGNDLVGKVKIYDNFSDLNKSFEFFNTIDLFLGMRLHAIIFSCLTSTPFYAIEYEQKSSDFLKSIEFENFLMKTDNLDDEKVFKELEEIYQNIDELQNQIFNKIKLAKQNQKNTILELIKNL